MVLDMAALQRIGVAKSMATIKNSALNPEGQRSLHRPSIKLVLDILDHSLSGLGAIPIPFPAHFCCQPLQQIAVLVAANHCRHEAIPMAVSIGLE